MCLALLICVIAQNPSIITRTFSDNTYSYCIYKYKSFFLKVQQALI